MSPALDRHRDRPLVLRAGRAVQLGRRSAREHHGNLPPGIAPGQGPKRERPQIRSRNVTGPEPIKSLTCGGAILWPAPVKYGPVPEPSGRA